MDTNTLIDNVRRAALSRAVLRFYSGAGPGTTTEEKARQIAELLRQDLIDVVSEELRELGAIVPKLAVEREGLASRVGKKVLSHPMPIRKAGESENDFVDRHFANRNDLAEAVRILVLSTPCPDLDSQEPPTTSTSPPTKALDPAALAQSIRQVVLGSYAPVASMYDNIADMERKVGNYKAELAHMVYNAVAAALALQAPTSSAPPTEPSVTLTELRAIVAATRAEALRVSITTGPSLQHRRDTQIFLHGQELMLADAQALADERS